MFRSSLIIGCVACALFVTDAQAGYFLHWTTQSSGSDSGREQAAMEQRRQIDLAQTAFIQAYAVAQRDLPLNDEVEQARLLMLRTSRDYEQTVHDLIANLEKRDDIHGIKRSVQELESRLDRVRDDRARVNIATDLMAARNQLSNAEWSVVSMDPDVTVARARYVQAAHDLAGLQQRQRVIIFQNSQVAAAKERLDALRHQLASGH